MKVSIEIQCEVQGLTIATILFAKYLARAHSTCTGSRYSNQHCMTLYVVGIELTVKYTGKTEASGKRDLKICHAGRPSLKKRRSYCKEDKYYC